MDTAAVTASWKFAAGEIFHLLGHVRDTGVGEMQELERKIADMVGSLSQQAETVEKLRAELRQQKEVSVEISQHSAHNWGALIAISS